MNDEAIDVLMCTVENMRMHTHTNTLDSLSLCSFDSIKTVTTDGLD